jgi:hypothetical protein
MSMSDGLSGARFGAVRCVGMRGRAMCGEGASVGGG